MKPFVCIEKVTKIFQDKAALDEVSINIPAGKIFGLLGPNGAGKTTLMRILVGILVPDSGSISISEASERSLKERIGYLPEERGLYQKMIVRETLEFMSALKGFSSKEAKDRIDDGLEKLQIAEYAGKKVCELSKGNQQRVQFLATILHKPDLLILDEPFTGLDPVGVDQLRAVLLEEMQRGATIIISTHIMEQAEQLCESIALINKGKVILQGSMEGIRSNQGINELEIEYEGDADAIQHLSNFQIVSSIDHTLRIQVPEKHQIPEIVRQVAERLQVFQIHQKKPSLHSIFVELVGKNQEE